MTRKTPRPIGTYSTDPKRSRLEGLPSLIEETDRMAKDTPGIIDSAVRPLGQFACGYPITSSSEVPPVTSGTEKTPARNLETEYAEVGQLVILGKELGYLAVEEVIGMLPDEIGNSLDVLEEVFSLLATQGIELVDAGTMERLESPGGQPPSDPHGALPDRK